MQINTANLSVSTSELSSLVSTRDLSTLTAAATATITSGTNITAADLSLADSYKISLWVYCATTGSNNNCTSPEFNWAKEATNTTKLSDLALSVAGVSISLPDTITAALKTFSTVMYWAEIVYVIAGAVTAVELLIGFFALCSRIGSCCTFIVSAVSTVAIIAASVLSTVLASITVGSIKAVAEPYGVTGSINTSFLATTWIAAAFSLASGLFWMFSICCCKGGSSSNKYNGASSRFRDSDSHHGQAPLVANAAGFGGYERVHDPYQPQESGTTSAGYGVPMGQIRNHRQQQGAYEPYSHGAV